MARNTIRTKYDAIVEVDKAPGSNYTVRLRSSGQELGSFCPDGVGGYEVFRKVDRQTRSSGLPIKNGEIGRESDRITGNRLGWWDRMQAKAETRSEAIEMVVEFYMRRGLATLPEYS